MKILVTGANGFIGRNIKSILPQEAEVIGIGHSDNPLPMANYKKIDVLDATAVEELFREYRFDKVIHLAAVTFHDDIVNRKKYSLDTSLRGTENIISAFNRYCSEGPFLYSSTGKVYGGGKTQPIDENTPANPMNTLGKLKRMTEELIEYYANDNPGHKFSILRMFNIYGWQQRPTFVIPYIMQQLKEGNTLTLGNIDDARDYINIRDLTNCISMVLFGDKQQIKQLDIYNVGSGNAYSVRDILEIISRLTGRQLEIKIDSNRLRHDETSIEYADISKIKKTFGWNPQISLEQGIREILLKENLLKEVA